MLRQQGIITVVYLQVYRYQHISMSHLCCSLLSLFLHIFSSFSLPQNPVLQYSTPVDMLVEDQNY